MKTTLAAATGIELARHGLAVLAIDLDPEHRSQGASLATWAETRAAEHPHREQLKVLPEVALDDADPARFELSAEDALAIAAAADPDTIVLIDCPSRATSATARIAAEADLVVFPLCPGDKDAVLTVVGIGRIVAAGIPADRVLVVLTRTGSDAEAADHRAWLEATDLYGRPIRVARAHIPERIAYRQAIGRGLTIREATPTSLRRIAGETIDAILEAFMAIAAGETTADGVRGAA